MIPLFLANLQSSVLSWYAMGATTSCNKTLNTLNVERCHTAERTFYLEKTTRDCYHLFK